MELRQYANLLFRWSWLVILAALVAGGAAFAFSRMQTPVYQATTQVLIEVASDERTTDYTAILTGERQARTYAQMFGNLPVLEKALELIDEDTTIDGNLKLAVINMDIEDLKDSISVQLLRDTKLIEVSVEHTNPAAASLIANMLVQAFDETIEELQSRRYKDSIDSLTAELDDLELQIQNIQDEIDSLDPDEDKEEILRLEENQSQLEARYDEVFLTYQQLLLAKANSSSVVVQVEPATIPKSPIRPRTMMNTLLATVVGAMLAIGLIFLVEYLDDTVRDPEEASQMLDLPVIGFFARTKNHEGIPFVAEEPRSPVAEAYRSLRSNIQFSSVDRPIRTILITSPSPEEGKSTVAANLAVVMAQGRKKVVLIDADMRRPQVHNIMGLSNDVGLTGYFIQPNPDLSKVIRHWGNDDLYVVTSGKLPPNPAELLGSERMSHFMDTLSDRFDMVIIDSPPVGVVTDPTVLASKVDGTLLVIEPKRTKMSAAEQAVEQLRRADANLIGLVFNNIPIRRVGPSGGYYHGYYYHQYSYSYSNGKDKMDGKGPEAVKKEVTSDTKKAVSD